MAGELTPGCAKCKVKVCSPEIAVTGHNPLAPLYTSGSYYKRLMPKLD